MKFNSRYSSVLLSMVVHTLILLMMGMFTYAVDDADYMLVIETVFDDEERDEEEFVQKLDQQKEIAETVNLIAGSVSTNIGGSEGPLSRQDPVEVNDVVREPDFQVPVMLQEMPAEEMLTNDLGEGVITGEVGAVVQGYGAALDRLTRELMRMMRTHKLTVVWLFDESESMKDDQQALRDRLYRVYEELRLVEKTPEAAGFKAGTKLDDVLLTSITSFGASWKFHTPQATADIRKLMTAIDRVPVDRTGEENMCQAMLQAIDKYKGVIRGGRKLVLVVVSDESGDDGKRVEEVIQKARQVRTPVYFLGRESVFGTLYAYKRWQHPDTKRWHLLPVRRGPETPFAEQLQYDGYGRRNDSHMSGFGPYEQVRIARDTGGIFFQLPHEEADLNNFDDRRNEMLNLREYLPSLDSRRVYAEQRDRSEFRKAIWDVIKSLNPYDPERTAALQIPSGHLPLDPEQFRPRTKEWFSQVMSVVKILGRAQQRLENVRSQRDHEPSLRWRANFDIIDAQLYAYRVRLFQYALALDQYSQSVPTRKFRNPKANHWSVQQGRAKLLMPTRKQEEQISKFLGTPFTGETLKKSHQRALRQLAKVREEHPGSPWSRRAEWELRRNFGVAFGEHFHDPKFQQRRRNPNQPKPSPPPKL